MEQLLREVLIYSPSHPNLLFSSIPSPRRTHSQFLSLCLKFYHNLLNSFSTFNLHTDHHAPRPPHPAPLPKSNLSMATRAISLKCKSDHLIVLFKPTCGSLLNSELSQSFLAQLLKTHQVLLRTEPLTLSPKHQAFPCFPAFLLLKMSQLSSPHLSSRSNCCPTILGMFLLLCPGLINPTCQGGSRSFLFILSSRPLAQLEYRPFKEFLPGFLLPWVLGANLTVWVFQDSFLVCNLCSAFFSQLCVCVCVCVSSLIGCEESISQVHRFLSPSLGELVPWV